jgi:uncharacterized protein (DUF58 family)
VPPRERLWLRWQGPSPSRGRYQFANIDLVTRSPFGLLERRVRTPSDDELIVYPRSPDRSHHAAGGLSRPP